MLVGAPGYGNLGMVRWRRTVGSWMTPGTFGCWHRPAWLRLGTVLSSSKGKVTACARFTLALCETFFKAQQERVKQSRMGRYRADGIEERVAYSCWEQQVTKQWQPKHEHIQLWDGESRELVFGRGAGTRSSAQHLLSLSGS